MVDSEDPILIPAVTYGSIPQVQHPTAREQPSSPSQQQQQQQQPIDRSILTLAGVYTILLVFLFALPRYIAKNSTGTGFDDLIQVLGVIFFFGGGAGVVAIVTLSVAMFRWNRLSRPMKILSIYPVLCSLLILAIFATLAKVKRDSDGGSDDLPACPPGEGAVEGIDCPPSYIKNNTDDSITTKEVVGGYPNYKLRHLVF